MDYLITKLMMLSNTIILQTYSTPPSGNISSRPMLNPTTYENDQIIITQQNQLIISIMHLPTDKILIMNSNQKGPLNPQQLFHRLIKGDYRESECVQQSSRLQQQRQILIQLICEYQGEIKNINMRMMQQHQLMCYRQKLLVELQSLRNQRNAIEERIRQQVQTLRVTPVELKDHASIVAEIDITKARNNKLRIKVQDLLEYIAKLQFQNKRIEQERRMMESTQFQRRQHEEQNWRARISLLQRENISYEQEVRKKIKEKQDLALRNIQTQQLQIRQRNRRRMESFKASQQSTPYHRIDNRRQAYENHYSRQV